MRTEDAIKLQVARQKKKNKEYGRPILDNCISKARLGSILWPEQKGKSPAVSMSELIKGKKTIRLTWIYLICKHCEVDPNFLFNKPSKHDGDFEVLVNF